MTAVGMELLYGVIKNVPKLDFGDDVIQLCEDTKNHLILHFKCTVYISFNTL